MHLAVSSYARNKGNQEIVCQKNMHETSHPNGDYEKDVQIYILF